jgi:hypothetical protein
MIRGGGLRGSSSSDTLASRFTEYGMNPFSLTAWVKVSFLVFALHNLASVLFTALLEELGELTGCP